ncbi:DUF2161 domain-containing phosphodiesterase [Bacillus sp. UMB0893]|uniref:DUF2161 domain-containing phosphodiesterase n=1 Tax=Bacillus sp. UMB0893 TaxID=2066053 RepID=UPI000C75B57C|nr:DUF2161 family putative PD-(D/E)XK-type phosphodiesterase [Bacillus sp. UMB0893]PLR69032.1 hypothetical protein CYJ36_00780 [Bacillus sp. UMB0893]QNG59506.1 hypothetical protein H4O14_17205 [Bacillus sp. PAMC26568]
MKNNNLFEKDLYKPIQKYFIKHGYEVYGEVKDCDLAAVKENELILVELKLRLNVELLIQAAKRQRFTDQVYIAIPKPSYSLRSKKWKDLCYLVRRLELGLIVVSFRQGKGYAEIKMEPDSFDRVKSMKLSQRKRAQILAEIEGRSGDHNVGGVNKTKIMTAYKERCIHIACCLEHSGPQSPKNLREMGTGDKTLSILNKNYYGWFDRVKRGTYALSEAGKKDLMVHEELRAYFYSSLEPLNR